VEKMNCDECVPVYSAMAEDTARHKRKWILSVEGVQIKKSVVQLMSMMTDPKIEAPEAQQIQSLKRPKLNREKMIEECQSGEGEERKDDEGKGKQTLGHSSYSYTYTYINTSETEEE
jgi:hypothetical protein